MTDDAAARELRELDASKLHDLLDNYAHMTVKKVRQGNIQAAQQWVADYDNVKSELNRRADEWEAAR